MKFRTSRRMRLLALLFAFAALAAACGSSDDDTSSDAGSSDAGSSEDSGGTDEGASSEVEGSVNISGSSTVEPISTRVAELFEDVAPAVEVTVDGPGTGDGFKLFCAGETDISDASRAIKDAEAETCAENGIEYVELKVAFDGIAVMTNPNNDLECVTFTDLYALLGAEADGNAKWSDSQAVATDMGSTTTFPDEDIFISAPGTESGTYDSFIEIVLEKQAEGRGMEDFIRTDFAGQADDNVIIQGIAGDDYSLGWVGFAFAEENKDVVKSLLVDKGDGCTAPTIETIADGSYPVSRSLYIYVNQAKAAENAAVEAYVDFYLAGGYTESVTNAFGDGAGYVALPDDLKAETDAAWAGR